MNLKRIEEVSLNSWPALEQMLYDGWILRFADGYTKRANSINPLYPGSLDVEQKISTCEAIYGERGLPPVFRLTPFSSPSEIDKALERREYKILDETLVLACELTSSFGERQPLPLRLETVENWWSIYCQLRQFSIHSTEQQTHLAILQKIPAKRLPMVLVAPASIGGAQTVVCCAMGVLEGQYVGLFNMFTAPEHRNKGYGTQLVSSMLHHAQQNGATHAYLQVMKENAPARRLYAKVGFKQIYDYWYRVP